MIHSKLMVGALVLLSMLLFAGLVACGEAATPEPATEAPTATTAPEPTAVPTEEPTAMAEEPTEEPQAEEDSSMMMEASDALKQYATDNAGGPGAIYVGDINQMVGPAPLKPSGAADTDLGDSEGNVPLSALEDHLWLYDSDYYWSLLERASLENPTALTSSGESITVQHACINRALLPCKIIEQYWAPNLEARTNGQLLLEVSSFRSRNWDWLDRTLYSWFLKEPFLWPTFTPATWLVRSPPSKFSPCGASTPTGKRCITP